MNEGKTRRRYDREFKEGAVRVVLEGGQIMAGTAKDLGIIGNMLQRIGISFYRTAWNRWPESQDYPSPS